MKQEDPDFWTRSVAALPGLQASVLRRRYDPHQDWKRDGHRIPKGLCYMWTAIL